MARLEDPEAVLVVASVEVFVYGAVELAAAGEAFSRGVLRVETEDDLGEVFLKVPGEFFQSRAYDLLTACMFWDLERVTRKRRPALVGVL